MRRKRLKRDFVIIILFIILSVNTGLLFKRLEKPFSDVISAYATQTCNKALNYAVSETLKDVSYRDLINLSENKNNQITSMSVNGAKISCLKTEITDSIQQYLNKHKKSYISLHAGMAQGNPLLSAIGPRIVIMVMPHSKVNVSFKDKFQSAGINQVRHCVYMNVEMHITLTSYTTRITQKFSDSILVADTIIVGNVPLNYGGYFPSYNKNTE